MAVQTKAKYGRVVLKLSGEALLGDREFGISPEYTKYLAEEIRKVRDLGVQVAVVIGGGNNIPGAARAGDGNEEGAGPYIGLAPPGNHAPRLPPPPRAERGAGR